MAEQVRPETHSGHVTSSSSNKIERNASKPRGSGSPFKCIGLGLAQQLKLEKDEEITAARLRIEELEYLAVNRQKEVAFVAQYDLKFLGHLIYMIINHYSLFPCRYSP